MSLHITTRQNILGFVWEVFHHPPVSDDMIPIDLSRVLNCSLNLEIFDDLDNVKTIFQNCNSEPRRGIYLLTRKIARSQR